jgi:hypothetical protein
MGVQVDLWFMSRTFRIRFGDNIGTAFYIEVGGTNFLATAKHIVPHLAAGESIAIRNNEDWQLLEVERTTACQEGTDVAVIKLVQPFGEAIGHDQLDSAIAVGQDVGYCGFPLGLENEALPDAPQWPLPLVKSGMLSGARMRDGVREYMFDTLNNIGFSGGPIIKRDPDGLKVVGIVSGYHFDAPLSVQQRNDAGHFSDIPDYRVRPNSGFMIGTPILRAVTAAMTIL